MRLDSQLQEEKLGAHACERAAGMEEYDDQDLRNCNIYQQTTKHTLLF